MKTLAPIKIKNIHFIINPAAGKSEPVLSVLNDIFKDTGINWDVSITKEAGDGLRLCKDNIKKADVIGVYGGDGTVMEVIGGMIGSQTPLAILPGGTGNVVATDLGIPQNLKEAGLFLTEGPSTFKTIDVGQFNKQYFLSRTSLGFEAEMVKGADREKKNKFGRLAYFFSAIAALKKNKLIRYEITVDHEEYHVKGISCIVANSGNIGLGDLSLNKNIDISDGLLDVLVIKKGNLGLFRYMLKVLFKRQPIQDYELVDHRQGKDIKVSSHPAQIVQCDGEILGKVPIHAKIIPQAVKIIVPVSQENRNIDKPKTYSSSHD